MVLIVLVYVGRENLYVMGRVPPLWQSWWSAKYNESVIFRNFICAYASIYWPVPFNSKFDLSAPSARNTVEFGRRPAWGNLGKERHLVELLRRHSYDTVVLVAKNDWIVWCVIYAAHRAEAWPTVADVARSRQYSGWRALAAVKQGESDTVLLSPEYLSPLPSIDWRCFPSVTAIAAGREPNRISTLFLKALHQGKQE